MEDSCAVRFERYKAMDDLIFETTSMAEELLKSTTASLKSDLPFLSPLVRARWDSFLLRAIRKELSIRRSE